MGKSSKISCIVRLRQMLRRWRHRATSRSVVSQVPSGHVAVRVGPASRRFVVPAVSLNHPAFRELLAQAEEEYGFSGRPGTLSLPCDESSFLHVLHDVKLKPSSSSSSSSPLDDSHASSLCCLHVGLRSSSRHADSLPLLHGINVVEKSSVWGS